MTAPWPVPASGTPGPPSSPPECLSWVERMKWCYDNAESWDQFIEDLVHKVLRENPDIVFEWPPYGVTDGTLGAPAGQIGELKTQQWTGNFTNVSPTGSAFNNLFAMALQAGSWEISYLLQIMGGQVLSFGCQVDPNFSGAVQGIPGRLVGYTIATSAAFTGANPMPALPLYVGPIPYANTTPQLLIFQVLAWSGSGTTVASAPFQFNLFARRVR